MSEIIKAMVEKTVGINENIASQGAAMEEINANIEDWENADYSSLINTCSFPYEPLPEYRKEQLIKLYGEPKDINDFVN